jgi:hypothetical protein
VKVFEIFYKKQDDNLVINSIKVVKHGFYLPYYFPIIVFIIAIKQRCLLLSVWSFITIIAAIAVSNNNIGIIFKVMLLLTFALTVPDIKRFDLIKGGYINGGCFAVKNKQKAITKFFTSFAI